MSLERKDANTIKNPFGGTLADYNWGRKMNISKRNSKNNFP